MNTTQYSELDRVKLKIKALTAKTVSNGCTEQEALAAMQGVGRLLSQYNLTMNEIDVRDNTYKTIYVDIGRKRRHPINGCVMALAAMTNAKTWFSRYGHKGVAGYHGDKNNSAFAFFGVSHDMELIEYLFNVIKNAIDTETTNFKTSEMYVNKYTGEHRKSMSVCFQKGMASRISSRLYDIKKQNDSEMEAARANTGRALMVLKGQLIKDAFEKEGIKLTKSYSFSTIRSYDSYAKGQIAGEKVNLSRPLGNNKKPTRYLT